MNLKEYRPQPDEGLFDQISGRLQRRRMVRIGTSVAVAIVAVVAVVWLVVPDARGSEDSASLSRQVAMMPDGSRHSEAATSTAPAGQPAIAAENVSDAVQPTTAETTPAAAAPVALARGTYAPLREEHLATRAEAVLPALEASTAVHPMAPADAGARIADLIAAEQPDTAVTPAATTAKSPKDPGGPVHVDNLVWAPNVIVPDGDVDDNRTFKLKFSSTVSEFKIYIYNRGGRQVYASNDPDFRWDATYRGERLPQSTYVWVAKFKDTSGDMRHEKGTVTVLR